MMANSIQDCTFDMSEKNVNMLLKQQLAFDFTLTERGQRAMGSKHSAEWIGHFAFP